MSAPSYLRLFLASLISALLLTGCAVKGSVRLDPREPEQPVFDSKVLVSEDIDPPVALQPDSTGSSSKQEPSGTSTIEDELAGDVPEEETTPPTREELIKQLTRPINFALDDASLSEKQTEQLQQLAAFLLNSENERLNLRIEGHCDDRGTREYNFALGERRAAVIAQKLILFGVQKDRLKTISYGKERLAYSGTSEFARARNRRGEMILKPVFELANPSQN